VIHILLAHKYYRVSLDAEQCEALRPVMGRLCELFDPDRLLPLRQVQEQIDLIIEVFLAALARFHPEMDREKLLDLVDKTSGDRALADLLEYWFRVSGARPHLRVVTRCQAEMRIISNSAGPVKEEPF
jgi:hypothetical protein